MEPISIWRPRLDEGEWVFVRPRPSPLGDHFAARLSIPARKPRGTRRICWFGESAAAGYLYAPHLTPAALLESTLARASGPGRYEVVDLARTNETLAGLLETVRTAMQLEPDLLALFTGNNWNLLETPELSPYQPWADGRAAVAAALEERGALGVTELAGRRRLARAAEVLEGVAGLARRAGIPVVVVVPEVNLADWEARQPVAWLPGDGSRRWHELYERAVAATRERRWAELARLGGAMLGLDEGSCPATYRFLARALAEEGEAEAARSAAEAEVSSQQYPALCFLGAPQASVADQQLLRDAAARHELELVDLPAIFAEAGDTLLPGRRFFLDYCHLTSEGMQVAVAGVASRVLRLEGREVAWRGLITAAMPQPAPGVEAVARLGAAIHTAHRLLPVATTPGRGELGIVAHWLEAALAASPGALESMVDVALARIAPLPEMLTPAQGRSLGGTCPLGFQHGWRWEHLDLALLAEIRRLLGRVAPERLQVVDRELLRHHDVQARPRNLVYPPLYLWEAAARFHPEVVRFDDVTERAVLRSPWPVTELGFVESGGRPLVADIEARLQPLEGGFEEREGALKVLLDGRPVGGFPLSCRWSRGRVALPASGVGDCIRRLSICWPELPAAGDAALASAVARLERGVEADIHPVFGELFSVRVGPEGERASLPAPAGPDHDQGHDEKSPGVEVRQPDRQRRQARQTGGGA